MKSQVHEEIGDIIWYLFALARRLGLKDAEWPHSRYLSKSPSSSENLIFSVADVIGEFFESDEDRNDTPPGEGFKKNSMAAFSTWHVSLASMTQAWLLYQNTR